MVTPSNPTITAARAVPTDAVRDIAWYMTSERRGHGAVSSSHRLIEAGTRNGQPDMGFTVIANAVSVALQRSSATPAAVRQFSTSRHSATDGLRGSANYDEGPAPQSASSGSTTLIPLGCCSRPPGQVDSDAAHRVVPTLLPWPSRSAEPTTCARRAAWSRWPGGLPARASADRLGSGDAEVYR